VTCHHIHAPQCPLAPYVCSPQVANLAAEEIPQIYAACGRGSRSTLRVLRPGLAVTGKPSRGGLVGWAAVLVGSLLGCSCRTSCCAHVVPFCWSLCWLCLRQPSSPFQPQSHLTRPCSTPPLPCPAEMAVSPLPGNPTAVWTIKRSAADEFDAYIIVSFSNATLVLRCVRVRLPCCRGSGWQRFQAAVCAQHEGGP